MIGTAIAWLVANLGARALKIIGGALAVLAILGGVYAAGYRAASRQCEAGKLREQLAKVERDRAIAVSANANAKSRNDQIEAADQENRRTIHVLAEQLERARNAPVEQVPGKPGQLIRTVPVPGPGCAASDDDLQRLRDIR